MKHISCSEMFSLVLLQVLSKESFVPLSPSDCSSQDSGTCDFYFEEDGDDDGFIDDLVQEQSKEVRNGIAWSVDGCCFHVLFTRGYFSL